MRMMMKGKIHRATVTEANLQHPRRLAVKNLFKS